MKHIAAHGGLMFEVIYQPDPSSAMSKKLGPIIDSVRVLDSSYKPVGPNMVEFFDNCYIETIPGVEASKFVSILIDELA